MIDNDACEPGPLDRITPITPNRVWLAYRTSRDASGIMCGCFTRVAGPWLGRQRIRGFFAVVANTRRDEGVHRRSQEHVRRHGAGLWHQDLRCAAGGVARARLATKARRGATYAAASRCAHAFPVVDGGTAAIPPWNVSSMLARRRCVSSGPLAACGDCGAAAPPRGSEAGGAAHTAGSLLNRGGPAPRVSGEHLGGRP